MKEYSNQKHSLPHSKVVFFSLSFLYILCGDGTSKRKVTLASLITLERSYVSTHAHQAKYIQY